MQRFLKNSLILICTIALAIFGLIFVYHFLLYSAIERAATEPQLMIVVAILGQVVFLLFALALVFAFLLLLGEIYLLFLDKRKKKKKNEEL